MWISSVPAPTDNSVPLRFLAMRPRHMFPTVALVAVLPIVACSPAVPSTEDRLQYLREVARQGAETGRLLRDQEAPNIDKARCGRAFDGLTRPEDYPSDQPNGGVSKEWAAQIREVFIDSCVSGKAKAGSTSPTTTTTTTTTAETTTTTAETTTTTETTTAPDETTTTTTTTP